MDLSEQIEKFNFKAARSVSPVACQSASGFISKTVTNPSSSSSNSGDQLLSSPSSPRIPEICIISSSYYDLETDVTDDNESHIQQPISGEIGQASSSTIMSPQRLISTSSSSNSLSLSNNEEQHQQQSSSSNSNSSNTGSSVSPTIKIPFLTTTWSKSTVNGKDDECKIQKEACPSSGAEESLPPTNSGVVATTTAATPWDRILQCFTFNVFKPKKVSSIDTPEEIKTCSGGLRKNMTESDFFLYELSSKSEILDCQDTMKIGKNLPARAIGYPWELTFSTSTDGFSLHSLYRKMDDIDSPVLLIIQDVEGRVFGAILSCAIRVSDTFYGNSDTFLFRCRPNFEVFKWSGDNFYFIQGQDDFISLGSDGGKFGLWLDDNLYIGRTEECCTFRSPPLVEEKDFKIKTVECWTVGKLV